MDTKCEFWLDIILFYYFFKNNEKGFPLWYLIYSFED